MKSSEKKYGKSEEFKIYQKSRRVPRLTDWIRRAVNAWGIDIGSEKASSFLIVKTLKSKN